VVSTKCIGSWALEFVVSNITGNNQWENGIFFGLNNEMLLVLHDLWGFPLKTEEQASSNKVSTKQIPSILTCTVKSSLIVRGLLNSLFQTLQAIINGKMVFCWIFIFML
jgi:hypothetical protein